MTKKQLPSPELLRKLLRYEPETGKLFWLQRPVEMFKASQNRSQSHVANLWNSKHAGREAFTCQNSSGYKNGRINGVAYLAHRIAWRIANGCGPFGVIDHIDGNTTNNVLENLRDVAQEINQRNAVMYSSNKTGSNGVHFDVQSGKWKSQIYMNGKRKNLGRFSEINDAIAARKKAEIGRGFTDRHGT